MNEHGPARNSRKRPTSDKTRPRPAGERAAKAVQSPSTPKRSTPKAAAPKAAKPVQGRAQARTAKVQVRTIKATSAARGTDRKSTSAERERVMSLVFGALFVCCLAFSLLNLHPTTATSASKAAQHALALATPMPAPVAALPEIDLSGPAEPSGALELPDPSAQSDDPEPDGTALPAFAQTPAEAPDDTPERVHYTIPEEALAAQPPRKNRYGEISVDQADRIPELIQMARNCGLLRPDEEMVFDPDANFYRGREAKNIQFYLDDTILVILWKEQIDGNCVSFAEVRIADASQIRRKFAGDSFGSNAQYVATELAASANAVVAMNADYYLFRDFGIVVYNRDLYRFNTKKHAGNYKYNCIDTMFVNGSGDFLYKHAGEKCTKQEMQQYIRDNDVLFSIAFGPVLVENGQPLKCDSYPVGQVSRGYSRAGIGQVDSLHYLYMVLSHSKEKEARWTVNTFAKHFAEKGVQSAFCLDGGQTGEVVFKGEPYNHIDFRNERQVSDILYFGSALPPEGTGTK